MPTKWQRRIERARELAEDSPVLPEVLDFYEQIARFQRSVAEGAALPNLPALTALTHRAAPGASADPMHAFFARVLSQATAREGALPSSTALDLQPRCPNCGEKPVAAILRQEGDGAAQFLLCGICLTEWERRRDGCPNCGQADEHQRRVYSHEEFPHIRVEACETCRVYLKAIDLTINGRAVPEVDELASVVLDLWAAEQGYIKLQTNLFGM